MKSRFYTITEWDSTTEVVEAREGRDTVLIKYEDGITNMVTAAYFRELLPTVTVESITARCSRFSGWNLKWEVEDGLLRMYDPSNYSRSSLILNKDGVEVHGRLRHWGVTLDELKVLLAAIP